MGYFAENFDYVLEEIEAINEAYFGKTKDILAIEKAVHDLRTPYLNNNEINVNVYTPKVNQDPNKKKLQNAIKNAFGFQDVGLSIASQNQINAYTMMSSGLLDVDIDKLIQSTKKSSSKSNGFKYDPKDGIVLMLTIYSGLLLNSNYTDGEIMAVLLHEIGHNFSQVADRNVYRVSKFPSIFQALSTISLIINDIISFAYNSERGIDTNPVDLAQSLIIYVLLSFTNKNKFKKIGLQMQNTIDKWIKKAEKENPNGVKALGAVMSGSSIAKDAINSFNYLKSYMIMLPNYVLNKMSIAIGLLKTATSKIANPDGYSNEKFADQFPVMYGYGPDFISLMQKFSNASGNAAEELLNRHMPILPAILGVYYLPVYILQSELDEHPLGIDRVNMSMASINKELENMNFDDKTREKIQKDAIEMQNELDKYKRNMLKLGSGTAKNLYQATLNLLFKGSLRSKLKATHVNDDIDKFISELD